MNLWSFLFTDPQVFPKEGKKYASARVRAPDKATALSVLCATVPILYAQDRSVICVYAGMMDGDLGVVRLIERGAPSEAYIA